MADFNSSLPVRTENNGDVVVKIVDGTLTTQAMSVDSSGRITVKLTDGTGTALTSVTNGAHQALDVQTQSSGSITGGTAAGYSSLGGGIFTSATGLGTPLTAGQQAAIQLDSNGRQLVAVSNLPATLDTNYGVVGASTLRVAAQIGNATGGADFNAGATGAQTLRVVANQGAPGTIANGWFVRPTDGTNSQAYLATGEAKVSITQSLPAGSNNIGSVNQGTSPWITSDLADGSLTGGTAGTKSLAAGGVFTSATGLTTPLTAGQQAAIQVDSNGRILTVTSLSEDQNYGTVGATTLRAAAQIGNATGAADFNYGAVGAQTLRAAAQLGNATGALLYGAGTTTAQVLRVASNLYDSTGTPFSATNPLPVTMDTVSGTAIDDYKDAAAVAAAASDNHDYTVSAAKTLYFDQVIATASGKAKMLVAIETGVATGVFTTKFVQFNSTANTNMLIQLEDTIAVATGVRVRVTMTNLDKAAMDLYSTICGHEI